MSKYLPVIILLFFSFCTSARLKTAKADISGNKSLADARQEPTAKPATITLLAESSKNDNIFAYYQDQFHDSHNIYFERDSVTQQYLPVTIKTHHGLWLRFTKGMAQYPVYVQPGDTLRIKSFATGEVKYIFEGKKPGDFNFYTHLDQQAFGLGFTDIMGVEINHFKFRQRVKMLNYLYTERQQFLNRVKDSLALTPAFTNYVTNHITSVYLTALLTPYYAPEFKLSLPQTYLDTLAAFQNSGFFKRDSLVFSSEHYRRSIGHYNRFLSRQSLKTPHETEALYQSAAGKFTGHVRNYALFALLKEKINKDLDMAAYLNRFRQDCTYPPYIRYLDSLTNRPAKLTNDKMLLANALVTVTDEATTWENILQQNKGKVMYIDLWATWCAPCLLEMPASVALQEKLKGKKIAFVNITVDKPQDKEKWKKALVTHTLNKGSYQNYMVAGDSPLAVFMHGMPNGVSVPQYILIDKTGKVATLEAKRPSDDQLLNEMLTLINK